MSGLVSLLVYLLKILSNAFISSLVCLTNIFFKPQDNTIKLYELAALARGLDIQKNLAEEAFAIHTELSSDVKATMIHRLVFSHHICVQKEWNYA
jgi:hypothetical protein